MMTVTIWMSLVLGVSGHVTGQTTVLAGTSDDMSFPVMLRTASSTGSPRVERGATERYRRRKATARMKMRSMRTVSVAVRMIIVVRSWRCLTMGEQGHALH